MLAENMESMRFFLRMSRPEKQGLNGQRTPRLKGWVEDMGHQAEAEKKWSEETICGRKL